MGTSTPVHSSAAPTSGHGLTIGVGVACLALGFFAGRFSAPRSSPPSQPPQPVATARVSVPPPAVIPTLARSGLAGFSDALDEVAKKSEAANRAMEGQRSGSAPQPTAVSLPSAPPDLSDAEFQLKTFCAAKWATDYSMQAYCQQQQRDAVAKLQQPGPLEVPYEAFAVIRATCASKWADDFTVRAYCEAQQVKGYLASR